MVTLARQAALAIGTLVSNNVTGGIMNQLVVDCFAGSEAMMNGIVFNRNDKLILAGGGFNGRCKLYELITKLAVLNGHTITNGISTQRDRHASGSFSNSMLRRRTSSISSDRNGTHESSNGCNGSTSTSNGSSDPEIPQITYEMSLVREFEADQNDKVEPFLKVVRYSPDFDVLVTGGSDGHIRTWDLSSDSNMKCILDISAHTDEIDDLDIDPSGKQVASASLDGCAFVWDLNNGKKLFNLEFQMVSKDPSKPIKYRLRRCRFSPRRGNNTILYATMLPVVMKKPPDPCYICRWDTTQMRLEKRIHAGYDNLTNLNVSEDGRFLGVGTLLGTVAYLQYFRLQRLYRMENSHKSFVTGIQFLKCSPVTQIMAGDNEASLVTISVDNKIIVHHIPKSGKVIIHSKIITNSHYCFPTDPFAFLESSFLFVVILILVYLVIDLFGL